MKFSVLIGETPLFFEGEFFGEFSSKLSAEWFLISHDWIHSILIGTFQRSVGGNFEYARIVPYPTVLSVSYLSKKVA